MERFTNYQFADCNKNLIKKNFIIRHKEFNNITGALSHRSAKEPLQHELILGRRGSGKSTLLKRIEIEIEEKVNKKYIPINLAEEQASIYRLFDLWLEIIEYLKNRFAFQPDIKDYHYFDNEIEYTRHLYLQIHKFCTAEKKQIVLLLDNFDRIVENSIDENNLLLEALINYNDLIIIAASTRMDEAFWQHDISFYKLFRRHRLEALTIDEIKAMLYQWAETANISELKKFTVENPGKLHNIRITTDALPRTIQFLIQLIAANNYANEGVDYLKEIMDNITPIYQERLNNLPPQLRKMVMEMAFIWEACTTKELVDKCKMESKLISANLKTLSDRGIVDKIETEKRNLLYRISERFFNMWIIMTQGNQKQKLKAKLLRTFLENLYNTNCLKTAASESKASNLKNQMYTQNDIRDNGKTLKFEYSAENEDDGFKSFDLGNIFRVQSIYSEAEKYFLSAIEKGQVAAMFNLGNFYVNQNKFAEAEKYYLTAIEKGHIGAMYNLGVLFANQNKNTEAEKYYLLAAKKGDANAMYNLGLSYANIDKFEEAEKYYLLASERGHVNTMNNLGNLYSKQDKLSEAEKYYLLASRTGYVNAMYCLGNIYAKQNKLPEAEKYYMAAIEKAHIGAMYNLGNLYSNQGKFTEAEKYFLLAIENGNIDAMNNLGLLYAGQCKFAEAEKYFLSAITKEHINAIYNLGVLHANQGKYAKAEKYFLLAVEKNHENALYDLVSLYYQQNKNKKTVLSYIRQYEGCEDLRIIIDIWNGIFDDVEKRILAVVKEEPDNLFLLIIDLLIHQQKVPVLNMFNHPEVGKILQEKFKVLHYVCLLLNKKTENNLILKIPPEIKATIDEVIEYIVEKEKFYGY